MKNNQKYGLTIGLITIVITRIILSLIGVSKISTILLVIVLITASVVFAATMIKDRNKNKFGAKLSIITSILMLVAGFCGSLSIVMVNCYSEFLDKHKTLDLIITSSSLASFFGVVVFWIAVAQIMSKKN